ncbi:copper-binding protein [Gordonia phosphorivorans]|uniref:Copper-binding protein n=1 Tax=Gordonia phosphorivorans TaxID=1056982 RepID=A0ABV6HBT8_9ACTN
MSAFTRTTRRIATGTAISALGLAVALGTTACSSGKISQTNNQEAAINGANGTLSLAPGEQLDGQTVDPGSIAIRNLQIMYPSNNADLVFDEGGPFKLVFTIANDSVIRKVKLTGITAVKGKVEFINSAGARSTNPGDAGLIGPNTALNAGVPSNLSTDEAKDDGISRIDAELTGTGDTVTAGLSTPLTLHFEIYDLETGADGKPRNAPIAKKSITITTPVDGTPLPDRQDVVRDVQPPAGEGGH